MCGIHGIYRLDGQAVVPAELSAMGHMTRHRGPDDEGMHMDGACGIAMRRLAIIDVKGGHQPLSNLAQTVWVVCNGEIYNFRALRAELQSKGYLFKTGSDTEVLLHLYHAEGDDFVLRLNGMFAFAIWDATRRRLLLGRDRLGVKPLYLLQDGRRLAFSTEAKALLVLAGVNAALNRDAVASYLHLGYVAAPDCIFEGLRKLPPASLLAVEDGVVREWPYWRVPTATDRDLSEREWIDRVRTQLAESVRMQMISEVPIGAFLSGGVDSSAVVALMARNSDEPIRTYAIGFCGGEAEALYNELPYARQVAGMFGTQHREIVVQPDVVSLLPKLLWHMDEPLADTAFITTFLVSEFASEDVKVILSGVGGDELFGGYRRYLGGHFAAQYQRLPHWLRQSASALARRLPADRHAGWLNQLRLVKGFLASADMTADDRYRSYLQVLDRQAVSGLMLDIGVPSVDPLERAFLAAGTQDELNRLLAVDAQTQLPDDLLMLTDKMSMAVSVECRVPLLDHQLVELAAAMPCAIKVRGGRLKHVLKESLKGTLPDAILNRKKRGFGTPMGAWLRHELAPVLQQLLSPDVVRHRGLFCQLAIDQLVRDHSNRRIDGTDALMALMNLEIWSRLYLDHRDPADVAAELKSFVS
jgi:asparagine synthase (glutamine-hydrolysing)